VEDACNERAFFGNAGLFFDDTCQCEHTMPAAKLFPHGTFAVFHLVADFEVRGNHLSQYGLFIGVDGEWIRVRQQVTFKRVPFDAKRVGELRVLDEAVPTSGVEVREALLEVGRDFPGGTTFGDGHLADGTFATLEERTELIECLVGGNFVPTRLEGRFVQFTPQGEGKIVFPDLFFL